MSKVVLITGAAKGIGRAIAKRLAAEGWSVVLNYYTSEQAALALAEELKQSGADVLPVQADISDARQVDEMIKTACAHFGKIDALVNNAGISMIKLFTDTTDEEWHKMQAVHVNGAFYCSKAVLPDMIRRKSGKIVTIASMWGITGASCEVAYSTAKAALIGMTKALSKEVGPSGIQVNCVAPGVVQTDMMQGFSDEEKDILREETPLNRIGTPEDVAGAVSFLLSPAADFITGHTLTVDGGFSI